MIERYVRKALLLLGVLVLAAPSFAQVGAPAARNLLEQVNASANGDQVIVRLTFSSPLTAPPPGFALTKPARVALDLQATDSGLDKSSIALNQSFLRSLNVAQAGERTRLVFNLERPAAYQTRIDGKDLVVVLNAAPSIDLAAKGGGETFAPVEPTKAGATEIRDISFRRGKDGEGRVVVDLSDAAAGIDIRKQGGVLLVEFSRVDIPEKLLRKLDTTDFTTPVTTVTTARQGDKVRMTVAGRGNWEHIAYQADTQFVVELRALAEDSSKLGGGAGRYTGERLSLRFRDYPVKEVLQAFSDFASFNIVISEAVGGTISLNLQDVPWDQALDIILQQKNLAMKRDGNVMMIAPREEIIARNKVVSEAVSLELPQDAVFQVNYLTSLQAKTKVEEYVRFDPQQSKSFKIMAEQGSNKLFVKATESVLEDIRRILREIDLPPRQVLIEARIVEATDSFSRQLGARLRTIRADNITTGPRTTQLDFAGAVNIPVATGGGDLTFSLLNSTGTRAISLELSAIEQDGVGKIVSSPRVLATNGQVAKIEDGREIPYLQATSSGATSVAFKKAVLSLSVTPTINADGRVALEIQVNKDSPGDNVATGTGQAVSINTKQVSTKVVVENGGTVVIGGVYQDSEQTNEQGVPWLRDLPVLGWLFKTRTKAQSRSELLVFITPKIVNDQLSIQ